MRSSEFSDCLPQSKRDGGGRAEIPNSEFRIPNSREAGYTLVVLIMAIAVMAELGSSYRASTAVEYASS